MKYYSAIKRDEIESFVVRCVKLEPIMQGEISEEEKIQFGILTHIGGI